MHPPPRPRLEDARARPLRSLRISVTDRCNLRCGYCMPEEAYAWLPRDQLLSFEELERLARAFVALGVEQVRLTGGEPLLRADLPELVRRLAGVGVQDLALTTNGTLLAPLAQSLKDAGLHRITVSLDTLRPERFRAITRRDDLPRVLAGIHAARAAGLPLKLDTVLLRGQNEDELEDLLAFAREVGAELRFIEYMDVGGATRWAHEKVVSRAEVLARLGGPAPVPGRGSAPAERFLRPDGSTFGIVASTTQPFCGACDRVRLTADGSLYTCLYARSGHDLAAPLRTGASDAALQEHIAALWRVRSDRGAERRAELAAARGPSAAREELRGDVRLEMHTRGG